MIKRYDLNEKQCRKGGWVRHSDFLTEVERLVEKALKRYDTCRIHDCPNVDNNEGTVFEVCSSCIRRKIMEDLTK